MSDRGGSVMNIFLSHYKKRDGAIYKDLAGVNHDERIKMLNGFIDNAFKMLRRDAKQYAFVLKSIIFFQKLIKFCEKIKEKEVA